MLSVPSVADTYIALPTAVDPMTLPTNISATASGNTGHALRAEVTDVSQSALNSHVDMRDRCSLVSGDRWIRFMVMAWECDVRHDDIRLMWRKVPIKSTHIYRALERVKQPRPRKEARRKVQI